MILPIFIYFDALGEGDGGGCSVGGSFSIVSHGQTLQAVPDDSKVVSSCFGGSSLDWKLKALANCETTYSISIFMKFKSKTINYKTANKMHP